MAISALSGQGIDALLLRIEQQLFETYTPVTVWLPYSDGGLLSLFHESGQVERLEHTRNIIQIDGRLPGRLLARFKPFMHPPVEEPEVGDFYQES